MLPHQRRSSMAASDQNPARLIMWPFRADETPISPTIIPHSICSVVHHVCRIIPLLEHPKVEFFPVDFQATWKCISKSAFALNTKENRYTPTCALRVNLFLFIFSLFGCFSLQSSVWHNLNICFHTYTETKPKLEEEKVVDFSNLKSYKADFVQLGCISEGICSQARTHSRCFL